MSARLRHGWINVWWVLLVVLVWGLVVIAVGLVIQDSLQGGPVDFEAYYKAAARLVSGEVLYVDLLQPDPYLYPPLLAQLLTPLAATLGILRAAQVW